MPDAAKTPRKPEGPKPELAEAAALLRAHGAPVAELCAQGRLAQYGGSRERFEAQLAVSVAARFAGQALEWAAVESYLARLHLEDLALACGCADGAEAAWDFFVREYRGYLRAAAGAMLKRGAESPEARELADSLFAELYGLADGRRGEKSLFRYFHGRSSLKTWLRAVLAQRHVDGIRAARRFESLDDEEGRGVAAGSQIETAEVATGALAGRSNGAAGLQDPHREKYVALFCAALGRALERLQAADRRRVSLYYAESRTLAEIGRMGGEHESSVSRNLERIRGELRAWVEEDLRGGGPRKNGEAESAASAPGLSDAQIALCFEYATEDAPIDLDALFADATRKAARGKSARQEAER
jgi:RNA polymerase sigma-70 factor (ECF subfamily)